MIALIVRTFLRTYTKEDWSFDSGCSRHMTGVQKLLVYMKPHSTRYVTFSDGTKNEIKGVGKMNCT